MEKNDMSDLHFTVRDKNGRHWGISGDKVGEFKKTLDNMNKEKTPEQKRQLEEFKDKMMEGFIDMEIKSHNGNMIVDVCFSGSICGELKLHLHKQYQEIISIPLFFDIGYLKDDALENQKENINNMYLPFGVSQKECDEIFDKIKQSIKSIVLYAQKGASFRIWNDNTPTSLCGFYYLINLLKDVDCKIYEMPFTYDCKPNLDDAEEVTAEQKQTHSCVWDLFVEENAPLRVFKNHILTSVPKTYYDDLILDIVDKKEMPVPKIVGEVLSKHKISDTYIFDRVYYLVEYGYLEITGMCEKYNQPNFYPYKHIVKRTGKVNAKEYRERLKKWSYDTLKLKSKILFSCSKETILKALELSTTIEDEEIVYMELKKLLDSEIKD
ncbi:MAG: DUF1835 domain-containing protein [Clostridia bacterium]|nr:DUF1835 domain-containing protein [Clostridia bacterium]